jgi:hypothetical protein
VTLTVSVRVDHVMESRDVMNIHVVTGGYRMASGT